MQYLPIQDRSHINPKMFNSFLDGTKSGIEMTAVCNATGLVPQSGGLGFPPASRFELAEVCKPRAEGGTLEKKGVTEVVSSLYRDGRDVPHHLAMGTYVVVESDSPYAAQCFVEYNCLPDKSGRYAALYRPTHMIGLELGISVASVALRKEPTGAPICFNSDVVATAKRALKKGEVLDGEGGFTVWGRQVPADVSLAEGYLPLGLASDVKLTRDIAEGQALRWSDVRHRHRGASGEGAPRDGGHVRAAQCLGPGPTDVPLSSSGLSRGSSFPRTPEQAVGWMVGTSPTMTTRHQELQHQRPRDQTQPRSTTVMPTSLYDMSVASYLQTVDAVGGSLAKGLDHCNGCGADPAKMVEARLAEDMLPLRFQVVSVAHHSLGAIDGMKKGVFSPPGRSAALDYAGLQKLVADARGPAAG